MHHATLDDRDCVRANQRQYASVPARPQCVTPTCLGSRAVGWAPCQKASWGGKKQPRMRRKWK